MTNPEYFGYKSIEVSSTPLDNKLPITNAAPELHVELSNIADVNNWVNNNITYEKDLKDQWKSPWSTVCDRKGDCEDYALLKRSLLIQKGLFKPEDTFLVIGTEVVPGFRKPEIGNHHALLAVRIQEMWLVLDNIAKKTAQDEAFEGIFIPIFSFNSDSLEWDGCRKYLHGK